jgi:hypothetical protein
MPEINSRAPTLGPTPRPRVAYYDLGIPFIGAVWNGFTVTYDPSNDHTLAWGAEFSQDGAHYFCHDLDTGGLEIFPMPCREHGPVFQAADGTIYALIMAGLSADHGHHLMVFDAEARRFSSLGRPAPGDQRLLCMEEREGVFYMGGHELAELFRYDPKQRCFENLCRPFAPPTDRLVRVQLLPDGRLLLVGYPATQPKIYDVDSGELSELPVAAAGIVGAVTEGGRLFVRDGDEVRVLTADFAEVDRLQSPISGQALVPLALGRNCRGSERGVVYAQAGADLLVIDAQSLQIRSIAQGDFVGIAGLSRAGDLVFAQVEQGRALLLDPASGTQEERGFEIYRGSRGSAVCTLGRGPDNKIYGTNIYGMHLCAIDPDTDEIKDLGYTWNGGELYHVHTHGDKLYVGSYGGSNIGVYDPARPWAPGADPKSNPRNWGPLGQNQNRPFQAVTGPDGRIYLANRSNYGIAGGSLASYDPATGLDDAEIYPDSEQSVQCVAADSQYVYGGTSIYGGRGAEITSCDGLLFVFDPRTKQRVCAVRPVEGANTVTSLAVHPSGLVFGTTDNRRLFVFDPKLFVVEEVIGPMRSEGTRLMGVPEGVEMFPLLCAADGFVYGLTRYDLFRIDASSRVLTYLNDPPLPELYALTEGSPGILYISAGTHVIKCMLQPPPFYR